MAVKYKQNLEAKISRKMKGFLEQHIGERPKAVKTQILGDTIIVRFRGISPPAERNMSRSYEGARTIKELKDKIITDARPLLENLIQKITKLEVADVHSSFDIKTDERIEIFTLASDLE
ncbi:MAG: DUF2294 domain-containing protein [Candidatus Omnitrophota bacterium]